MSNRVISLALEQSCDFATTIDATLKNMDRKNTWMHQEHILWPKQKSTENMHIFLWDIGIILGMGSASKRGRYYVPSLIGRVLTNILYAMTHNLVSWILTVWQNLVVLAFICVNIYPRLVTSAKQLRCFIFSPIYSFLPMYLNTS